jgi:hypothetical protein
MIPREHSNRKLRGSLKTPCVEIEAANSVILPATKNGDWTIERGAFVIFVGLTDREVRAQRRHEQSHQLRIFGNLLRQRSVSDGNLLYEGRFGLGV